ncbi:MAG: MlaD family protein [Prolixibacteraceae bacterium]|nr:MlaD family protein [Prolixibacteraceae bacterium]
MRVSKYVKLGILMVVSITILIWGLSFLQGVDILKKNNQYNVIYDRVDGLSESNNVLLSGYKIGQVNEIKFLPDNSGRLLVSFVVDASIRVPVNSVAQIVSSDLMGTRSIKLILSENDEFHSNNDTITGAIESDLREQVSMQVLPIKNKAEELLGTIDSAITILTVIFNEDARQNLSESFANINQSIINIEKTTADLQEIVGSEKNNIKNIITNSDSIIGTFAANTGKMENAIKNLSDFTDSLSQISITPVISNILEVSQRINAALAQLESTDNTAGLLLNDDELYESIKTLSSDLSLLINDMRNNPERYIHFSAIDLGKNVYVNTKGDLSSRNIIFKVHLVSSENKIPADSNIFEGIGEIEEYQTSGVFSYLTGESNSYNEITLLYEKVRRSFPDAAIVAFRNGRLIELEKALKYLK